MAHFAKISEENIVLGINVLNDSDCQNEEGVETESVGQAFLEKCHNWPAHLWIKTSYNTYENTHREGGTPFRGNYATIGGEWDNTNQIFWPEKPFPSWVKDTTIANWKSPIGDAPALTSEQTSQNEAGTHDWDYLWNEDNQTWDLTDFTNT